MTQALPTTRVPRPLLNRATYDRLADELARLPATMALRVTIPPAPWGTVKQALYLRFKTTHHLHMRRAVPHDDRTWLLWLEPKQRTT